MKKFFMAIAATFIAVSMHAQFYVGGSLGYETSSYDGKTLGTSFSILPEFGIKFSDQWGAGVVIGYGSNSDKSNASYDEINTGKFTFKPYARYSFLKMGGATLFADGGISYESMSTEYKDEGTSSDADASRYGLFISPGIAYNLSSKVSLVAKLGDVIKYSSYSPDYEGAKSTNTFSLLNLNTLNLSFGVYYNF